MMHSTLGNVYRGIAVGVGATIVMDTIAEVLRRTRGVTSLDYALVGRWIGHIPSGVVRHESIMAAEPVPYERELGWGVHYAIGTGFAVALVVMDPDWLDQPRFVPAFGWGIGTIAAPWLLMQPCFGMGVAASQTPNPIQARLGSLRAHAAYGLGIWASGHFLRLIVPRRR